MKTNERMRNSNKRSKAGRRKQRGARQSLNIRGRFKSRLKRSMKGCGKNSVKYTTGFNWRKTSKARRMTNSQKTKYIT